ncbi:MAG: DUF1576 domain-containing protein [Alkalibacterium sp.]|nr:DUF1576 domain-containing protein [Alkalibacterium sp.]
MPASCRTDYLETNGFSITLINMALLGFITVFYVLFHGGEINGPVIGGILTVVGFGAFGKHIRNVLPILIGVSLMGYLNDYDMSATGVIIAGLFGTTIAPIAGRYGTLIGILAGALHLSVVSNTGYLHGGIKCLYNNGFAGGFVAAIMISIIRSSSVSEREEPSIKRTSGSTGRNRSGTLNRKNMCNVRELNVAHVFLLLLFGTKNFQIIR